MNLLDYILNLSLLDYVLSPKEGTWYVDSKLDKRWNKTGRGSGLVSQGGPKEMKEWIEKCTKKYGEPPKDAVCGFEKD